jgi:hypothetical protein
MSDSGSEPPRHHPYTRAPSRAGTPTGLSDSDVLVNAALKELLYTDKHRMAILALPPGPERTALAKKRFPKASTSMMYLALFDKFFPPSQPTTPERHGASIPADPVTPTPQRIATPNPASSYEILFDDEQQQLLYQHLLEGLFPHPLAFFIIDGPEETVVDRILEKYYQFTRSHISTLTGLFPAFANYQSTKRQEAEFMRQETLISPQPDLVPVEDVFSAYHSPAPQKPVLASPVRIPSPVRCSQSVSLDAERAMRKTPSPARIDDEESSGDDLNTSHCMAKTSSEYIFRTLAMQWLVFKSSYMVFPWVIGSFFIHKVVTIS